MRKYLLPKDGTFYKANLHCHTTVSDGRKTPEEVKEIYKKKGYSIVAYTDHDVLISHPELTDDEFLALNGFEVEIDEKKGEDWRNAKCCHICFIGLEEDNVTQPCWHRTEYLGGGSLKWKDKVRFDENEPDFIREYNAECISKMMQTARNKGFFVTYNHPTWSRETYNEYMKYEGMYAFEMFNGGCISEGHEDYNPRVYDDLLSKGKLLGIGADDNHNGFPEHSRLSDVGWAWTMIKAPALEYREVTKALEAGHFYSSEGPEIYELWYEDGKVHLKCSPADRIYMIRQGRAGEMKIAEYGEELLTEVEFDLELNMGYVRFTVIDERGKHACTNAYFPDELKEE